MDLPDPDTPVNRHQRPQRNHHVEILQVVHARAEDAEKSPVWFVPERRARESAIRRTDISPSAIARSRRRMASGPAYINFPPSSPAPGAEIEQIVRGVDRVRIVLDDENRVAQIAQTFENRDQPVRVARMQSDRRFIQHVQRADQMRAQRRRQLNALRFAAGKRRSQPIE